MSTLITMALLAIAPAQHHVDDKMPILDSRETKKVLKQAEEQIARYRKANPLKVQTQEVQETEWVREGTSPGGKSKWVRRTVTRRIPVKSHRDERFEDHEGNPLKDRAVTFKMKFQYVMSEKDMFEKKLSRPQPGQERSNQMVVCGNFKAGMSRHFDMSDVYPELEDQIEDLRKKTKDIQKDIKAKKRELKNPPQSVHTQEGHRNYRDRIEEELDELKDSLKETKSQIGRMMRDFKEETKNLNHRLHVRLPEDFAPPTDIPTRVELVVRITRVEYDDNSPMPYFVFEGDLVKSEDLGLDATGIIEG